MHGWISLRPEIGISQSFLMTIYYSMPKATSYDQSITVPDLLSFNRYRTARADNREDRYCMLIPLAHLQIEHRLSFAKYFIG